MLAVDVTHAMGVVLSFDGASVDRRASVMGRGSGSARLDFLLRFHDCGVNLVLDVLDHIASIQL